MNEISTGQLLWIVNSYVLLGLMVFAISARALVCRRWKTTWCRNKLRLVKFLIAIVPMITCLAALAFGIFAIGMSHGSRPENYQVILFVLACFTPFVLFILWIIGFLIVDAVWFAAMMLLFFYFSWVNPVLYLRYWADDNYQWAQVLIAEYYEGGRGGVKLSKPMARFWYKKAALNGSAEAQYKIARNERHISNAKKYFLMAAEQGHVGAMIHLVRITNSPDEQKKWLDEALEHDHPENIFWPRSS